MRRVPVLPTLIVIAAAAAMIALGIWQLHRARWKEALLARYEVAATLPPIAFPALGGDETALFRRSSAFCLEPVAWHVEAGRNRAGTSGWRHLVDCRTGAEGPGVTLDMGWSATFGADHPWDGGHVIGVIASAPQHRSLIATLLGKPLPLALMIVSDVPAAGLVPSAPPSLDDIPNNHRAYAVQWFIFAGLAVLIYVLALGRRLRTTSR